MKMKRKSDRRIPALLLTLVMLLSLMPTALAAATSCPKCQATGTDVAETATRTATCYQKGEIKLLEYADNFFDFIDELKVLFGRDIDMVCEDAVKNPYFRKELDATKRLIYG